MTTAYADNGVVLEASPKLIILRRNHWGEDACKMIKENYPELQIINKDVEAIPIAKWCIRWATTSSLPGNPKVINKASAMHSVYNKAYFRSVLAQHGLSPKTVVNTLPSEDMYPVVLRPSSHSKSENLYIAEDKKEFNEALKEMKAELGSDYDGYYASTYIDKDRELRAIMVSGRLVALLDKIPSAETKDNVSWGVEGDHWAYVNWNHWPSSLCKVAVEAFRLSGLDFGAVDMMMKGNTAYCLEINTGPQITPYYAGQLAKGLKWIIEKNDRKFIEPGEANNYHSFIHPALIGVPN